MLFFVFSAVVSFLAHQFFCWLMALWPGRERRRYPVLAFVLCRTSPAPMWRAW